MQVPSTSRAQDTATKPTLPRSHGFAFGNGMTWASPLGMSSSLTLIPPDGDQAVVISTGSQCSINGHAIVMQMDLTAPVFGFDDAR